MIKTTTLSLSQSSSLKTQPKAEKIKNEDNEFGPSDQTIQNILNYSKALQVMSPKNTETVFGVMN